jgi:spore coat polysaccharide biosynthesis protein SpsF
MGSSRFPGKVLAPFRGEPVLVHVVRAALSGTGHDAVVVATSNLASDDPLAAYASTLGATVFRADAEDVVARFRSCALAHPCDWILRINADSPLLDPAVIGRVLAAPRDDFDIVTTTAPRTFPIGQNVELIRTTALFALPDDELTPEDREHVTRFFYRHPDRYRVLNVESGDPSLAKRSMAIDTLDDLRRLEDADA